MQVLVEETIRRHLVEETIRCLTGDAIPRGGSNSSEYSRCKSSLQDGRRLLSQTVVIDLQRWGINRLRLGGRVFCRGGDAMGKAGEEQGLSHVTTEAEWQFIEKELRENGKRINTDEPGLLLLKHIGLEMEVSPLVGRGRFTVSDRTCQPFGVLHGGMTGLIAESLASKTGQFASGGQPVQSIELNVNHVRAVPIGERVVVIAKPIMKGGRIQVWEVKFEKEGKKRAGGRPEMAVTAMCRVTLVIGSAIEPGHSKTPTAESRL